jgi:hypothetical protein
MVAEEFGQLVAKLAGEQTEPAAFFVGAGVSRPSGLPDFKTFTSTLLSQVMSPPMRSEDRDFLAEVVRPEVALQLLLDGYGDQILGFFDWFDTHATNTNHLFLAKALANGHHVFTTNLDCLVEEACLSQGVDLRGQHRVINTLDEYRDHLKVFCISGQTSRSPGVLFKLHGSISDRQTILFTLRQVGQGLASPIRDVLQHYLGVRDLCFLGYSAMDHFSVFPVLSKAKSDRVLYWCQYVCREHPELECQASRFQQELTDDTRSLLSGTKRLTEVGERFSVNSILVSRSTAMKWSGNTSQFIRDVMTGNFGVSGDTLPPERHDLIAAPSLPPMSAFQSHLTTARLFHAAYKYADAQKEAQEAADCAEDDRQRAKAFQLSGKIKISDAKYKDAVTLFDRSATEYQGAGAEADALSAILDLANARRFVREFDEAKRLLDAVRTKETVLAPSERSRLYALYALTKGLSDSAGITDSLAALQDCGTALNTAQGDVERESAARNAHGLVLQQVVGRQKRILRKADEELNHALQLSAYVGNARECFQRLRNLGLVQLLLGNEARGQRQPEHWRKAKRSFEDARTWLARGGGPIPVSDRRAAELGLGESLVKLRELSYARAVLEPLQRELESDPAQWHNEGRSLRLLLRTEGDEDCFRRWIDRIVLLAEAVLNNDGKRKWVGGEGIRWENWMDILAEAALVSGQRTWAGSSRQIEALLEKFEDLAPIDG